MKKVYMLHRNACLRKLSYKEKNDTEECVLVQRVWKPPLGEWQMQIPVLHAAPAWTVFRGELGPEGGRENWLTAIFHNGIFLPLAQHLNGTDRDSDKCTKRIGNLVSVTGLLSLGEAQKGNSHRFLETGLRQTLERIWHLDRPWVFLQWALRVELQI